MLIPNHRRKSLVRRNYIASNLQNAQVEFAIHSYFILSYEVYYSG